MSASQAFFDQHKHLFEYEKYVQGIDPLDPHAPSLLPAFSSISWGTSITSQPLPSLAPTAPVTFPIHSIHESKLQPPNNIAIKLAEPVVVAPIAPSGGKIREREAPPTRHPAKPSISKASGLLDSSLRVVSRKVDLARKIEQLVGPKYGRVTSATTGNLPPVIKQRLEAYSRLEQRKEALYQRLKAEYDEAIARSTRNTSKI
ncbi:unnamed protein product [Aphanomyces euteiches]|uniref:Uncharacterized protein n=1 Tax=Aphanomyces euteiches TaxID=100861 RepID=A0A6G0X9S4_9STRA|nr:hypothetical protein Ae201684_007103 [Aphanomyces euteiches]KAH9052450.1 hypothetical protein Ae201684P_001630 [Aphanomyces euteiches]KAH9139532.1 hypothetical protein AeRB84_016198 [Aphanomyces euteiches]